MSATTRTGLVPTPKRHVKYLKKVISNIVRSEKLSKNRIHQLEKEVNGRFET